MRISGTEPSSGILSQTKKFQKLESDILKVPKQAGKMERLRTAGQKDGHLVTAISHMSLKLSFLKMH